MLVAFSVDHHDRPSLQRPATAHAAPMRPATQPPGIPHLRAGRGAKHTSNRRTLIHWPTS
jgi:hypothetical protein